MIEGIGLDIVEIERVAAAVTNPRFRERVFTEVEQEYCAACVNAERYAGRFAAKEAVMKARGTGLRWREVEILRAESGAPVVRLHGRAAERLGGRRLHVTISHCRAYACAQALVESG